MRILLVEDDELLASAVTKGLRMEFEVDAHLRAEPALLALDSEVYDLLLLDLNLPGMSGLDLLRKIRRKHSAIPVCILTAKDRMEQKIEGLEAGADDYLVKPFDFDELLARVHALLRRSQGVYDKKLTYENITLDLDAKQVTRDNEVVSLSAREFAILSVLMQNQGKVMNKQQLEDKLYGWEMDVESNTIEVHISGIRKKLGKELIKTVRGLGYRI